MVMSIQDQIAILEDKKAALIEDNIDSASLAEVERKLAELKGVLDNHQERAQKQAEDLDHIVLPQNYNVAFGDPRANGEIESLIRQVKEQMWNRHNDEMGELDARYRSQVADLNQNLSLVQAERDSLNLNKGELLQKVDEAAATIHALTERAEDAESKRDAAAREILSLKGQINELEQTISAAKKPNGTSGFSFTLTSSLPKESDADKAARLKAEETERINANLARFGVKPLNVPTDQEIKAQSQKVEDAAKEAEKFPSMVQGDSAGQGSQTGAGEVVADDSITTQADGQTVEDRVTKLEVQLRVAREDLVLLEQGVVADIKRLEEAVFGKSVIEGA